MPISLNCPNCDRPITLDTELCPGCHQPVTLSSISLRGLSPLQLNHRTGAYLQALAANPGNQKINCSLGMCYFGLHLYDKAIACFEKAIADNASSADTYYIAAICLLRGKSPYMAKREDINKCIDYLNAANMLEPKAIYFYLLGYIKENYFERKYLNVMPNAQHEYASAREMGIYDDDIEQLNELLNIK